MFYVGIPIVGKYFALCVVKSIFQVRKMIKVHKKRKLRLRDNQWRDVFTCWTVRPLIWKRQRNEPQIGRRNDKGQPIERFHIRLGEIG